MNRKGRGVSILKVKLDPEMEAIISSETSVAV
jgi:hypothetical protein